MGRALPAPPLPRTSVDAALQSSSVTSRKCWFLITCGVVHVVWREAGAGPHFAIRPCPHKAQQRAAGLGRRTGMMIAAHFFSSGVPLRLSTCGRSVFIHGVRTLPAKAL